MITGIHHVSMKCETREDFEKTKHFYLNILNLSIKREWSDGIFLDTGNCLIEIFCNEAGIREKGAIRHFAFSTDNVDDIVQKIKEAGYDVFIEPHNIVIPSLPVYPARIAFCTGPLGEEIELFQDKAK